MPETVASTSDERTTNNVMRHEYRVLDDNEKKQMQELKDAGEAFVVLLMGISSGGTADSDVNPFRMSSRELSIAQTKIEEAVMWAVKHVTK